MSNLIVPRDIIDIPVGGPGDPLNSPNHIDSHRIAKNELQALSDRFDAAVINLPKGLIGNLTGPVTLVNCGTTTALVMALSVQLEPFRRYKVTAAAQGVQRTAASPAGGCYLSVTDSTTPAPLFGAQRIFTAPNLPVGTFANGTTILAYQTAAAPILQTINITGISPAGTLEVGANQATLVVEDMGPV